MKISYAISVLIALGIVLWVVAQTPEEAAEQLRNTFSDVRF